MGKMKLTKHITEMVIKDYKQPKNDKRENIYQKEVIFKIDDKLFQHIKDNKMIPTYKGTERLDIHILLSFELGSRSSIGRSCFYIDKKNDNRLESLNETKEEDRKLAEDFAILGLKGICKELGIKDAVKMRTLKGLENVLYEKLMEREDDRFSPVEL